MTTYHFYDASGRCTFCGSRRTEYFEYPKPRKRKRKLKGGWKNK